MLGHKTTFPCAQDAASQRQWHHMDADGRVLGRLASRAAVLLMGKHKPSWSAHIDGGDFVVVTNARKVSVTGKKAIQKVYFKHSGYPKGAKIIPYRRLMDEHPERVIELAVKRMLPKNKLASRMLTRLKIYPAQDHPHGTQHPTTIV